MRGRSRCPEALAAAGTLKGTPADRTERPERPEKVGPEPAHASPFTSSGTDAPRRPHRPRPTVRRRERIIATRRATFEKNLRERTKKAKAAAKRERRLEKSATKADGEHVHAAPGATDTPDDLLRQIEALHADFEAKRIGFDDFEARKLDLFERLSALDLP